MDDPVVDPNDPVVGHGVPPKVEGGYAPGVGTIGAALIPPLPISTEPSGIPVRAPPPDDTDGVGLDDGALPLALVPHDPEVVPLPGNDIPVPIPKPPPSKVVLEPDIPDDALPVPGHAVPLPIIPVVPAGGGLSPGDASSVEPRGIPAGGTGEPGAMPSGEVTPILGVGLATPPTCARTGLQPNSAATIAAVKMRPIAISNVPAAAVRPARHVEAAEHRRSRRAVLARSGRLCCRIAVLGRSEVERNTPSGGFLTSW